VVATHRLTRIAVGTRADGAPDSSASSLDEEITTTPSYGGLILAPTTCPSPDVKARA
jgi:hypothetical protein